MKQKEMTERDALPHYEVYALRYATMTRQISHSFMISDEHDGVIDMHFYVWLIRHGDRVVLVDTGFGQRSATARQRPLECCPIQALSQLGIEPGQVNDVILTHLHWDHAGNLDKLPNAVSICRTKKPHSRPDAACVCRRCGGRSQQRIYAISSAGSTRIG